MQDSFCHILVCRFTEILDQPLSVIYHLCKKKCCAVVAWTKKCEAELFYAALREVGVYLGFLRSLNI
jgi:hypothetical protein